MTPPPDRRVYSEDQLRTGALDAAAVASVLAGDTDVFRVLVERYRDSFTRFAVRMLGNADDADDVLQSAFVRAFRNIGSCQDPRRFGAWMYQIVVNECRTYATRRGRRELRAVRGDEVDAAAEPFVERGGPLDAAMVRDEIQRAIDQLEAGQREAFVLKYIEELSYEEIAEMTGVGVSALKMRVKRACDRLRVLLDGCVDA